MIVVFQNIIDRTGHLESIAFEQSLKKIKNLAMKIAGGEENKRRWVGGRHVGGSLQLLVRSTMWLSGQRGRWRALTSQAEGGLARPIKCLPTAGLSAKLDQCGAEQAWCAGVQGSNSVGLSHQQKMEQFEAGYKSPQRA